MYVIRREGLARGVSCARCRLRSLTRLLEEQRNGRKRWLRTSTAKRAIPGGSVGGFTQRQQVELIEGLFTSGQITRDEWRESVLIQAGLRRDASGAFAHGAVGENAGLEEKVRRLREWYAGVEVPRVLLEDGERSVYERLFGEGREVVVDEQGVGEEEEDGMKTRLLREVNGGLLQEVDVDVEEVDEGGIIGKKKKRKRRKKADDMLAEDMRSAMEHEQIRGLPEAVEESDYSYTAYGDDTYRRTHPLTLQNRFATSPSTLEMPQLSMVDPINAMLSVISNKHLSSSAFKIFGGAGFPYSTSTPTRGKLMPQKPIALDASQSHMNGMEADLFMGMLMPGMYSSIMGTLIETRKRLGTSWAEEMVHKAESGNLRILDAGAGGAGVLAVREMLRAEWERMHEDLGDESPMALAEVDGRIGAEGMRAPTGTATVLTGSDTLRKRASQLLDNTTFVPRLPDYIHTEETKKTGKFDIIVAPHGLWPLREDYLRKTHVQNLWSLLSIDGGVLLLLEKGVARGFELIAGARDMLLETTIASAESADRSRRIDEQASSAETDGSLPPSVTKETGMIVAPCTNHSACPMYTQKGLVKGRRDICAFSQRYHRPVFLQTIFGAKGKNHEDVEFSYLSVIRGRDLRQEQYQQPTTTTPQQSRSSTDRAFAGYEAAELDIPTPHSLSLPRTVYPPLKRQGHVILDVCTPAGTLERWTVPRSFSKAAYRDARKAQWGDLWALGAKTRVPRTPVVKKNKLDPQYRDLDVRLRTMAV